MEIIEKKPHNPTVIYSWISTRIPNILLRNGKHKMWKLDEHPDEIGELSHVCVFFQELRSYERLRLSTSVQFGTISDSMSLAIIYDSLSVQTDCYQTRPLETSGNKVYHVCGPGTL